MVCFSGGSDSSALLHIMSRLSSRYGFKLFAAHFNHRLRGRESGGDALFCRKICGQYGIKLFESTADTKAAIKKSGLGPEKTARVLRYSFFLKTAIKNKIRKIALAHTQDDNAETLLFRFIKGAGSEGLSGIPCRRRAKDGDFGVKTTGAEIDFIRPLIYESKKGLLEYLEKNRIPCRKDRSNSSDEYDRNKLRLKVIPLIERELNPSFRETVASGAVLFEQDNDYIGIAAEKELKKCVEMTGQKSVLFHKKYASLHPAVRYRVLRITLEKMLGGRRKITKNLVFATDSAILDKKRADLPLGLKIEPETGEKYDIIRLFGKI